MQVPLDKPQLLSLIQNGRFAEAKVHGRNYSQANPNDPEAWFLLAGLHAQFGELDQVVDCCRRVIALQPDNMMAHYNLGVALQTLKRFDEAMQAYRATLGLNPQLAQAHSNLGMVLWELGRFEDAAAAGREAVRRDPNLAQAHNNLGLALKSLDRISEAMMSFQEAVRLNPGLAEAHYNLGLCHAREGRQHEAMASLQEAVRRKPDYAEALKSLGLLQMTQDQMEPAIASFEQALRTKPDDAEIHNNLGNALMPQHRFQDAAKHFRRAVEIKPDFAAAFNNLGNALLDMDDYRNLYEEAEECYRRALRLQPDLAQAYFNLGTCYQGQGKYDQAMQNFERALALDPDYSDALAGLAQVMERQGNIERAKTLLESLEKKCPDNANVALAYAALSRHTDRRSEAIATLERMLQSEQSTRHNIEMHFLLGKLCDETGDYERAFAHYEQANALDLNKFDVAGNERTFNEIIAAYSAEKQARRPRASNRSRLPVFIVGMPRSGTSLVEQILASHPLIYGAGELDDMYRITQTLPKALGSPLPYPRCLDALTRKNIDPIAQRHLEKLGSLASGVARVTDKMPHNFQGLGLIELLFPEARVIHCLRDPMDTCLSIYFQHFNKHHPYANSLEHLGLYHNQYLRLMAHWKKTLRIPIMDIVYEDLVADPEPHCRALVEFCDLEWDDRCLRFHESKRVVTTPSYDQVRRPIYKKSVARWKQYERFLEPLIEALKRASESAP